MVNSLKKLFWKIQDFISSLAVRCELDFYFNIIHTILLIIILCIVIQISIKFFVVEKFLFSLVNQM